MKKMKLIVVTGFLAFAMSMTALAGEWKKEADGRYWYQNDDGR